VKFEITPDMCSRFRKLWNGLKKGESVYVTETGWISTNFPGTDTGTVHQFSREFTPDERGDLRDDQEAYYWLRDVACGA
jgi:hypothetical protein